MRIVFDLQAVQTESRLRGIGRYSSALVSHIAELAKDHDLIFVLTSLFPDTLESMRNGLLAPYLSSVVVFKGFGPTRHLDASNTNNRSVQEAAYNAFIADLLPDLVLVLNPFEGYVDDALVVFPSEEYSVGAVVYDLIPLLNPEDYLLPNDRFKEFYLERINLIKRYDLFLTISESSRLEVIENIEAHKSKVFNIDGAVDAVFLSRQPLVDTSDIVEGNFILYTGGADPRKNLKRLISAYGGLAPQLKNKYRLVLAGKIPEGEKALLNAHARALGVHRERLIYAGYVSDEVLRSLYSTCSLFVFPSYHEGLGLPVLEAIECGAPVIAANATSLPELVGIDDALFDPFDIGSIRKKIEAALTNEALREKLIANASEQGRKYSWTRTAQLAMKAINAVQPKLTSGFQEYSDSRAARYEQLLNQISEEMKKDVQAPEEYRSALAECLADNYRSAWSAVRNIWPLPSTMTWRLEGPFDSTYSLALLNRETARALVNLGHEVALHSTEGPGDFAPKPEFLRQNPDLRRLHDLASHVKPKNSHVVSRNLYPPRVHDMEGRLNLLHHYAWEESGFPEQWAEEFSDFLDGATCLSTHVRKIMIDNGVCLPMTVSGCGVDHWERVTPAGDFSVQAKTFKFLHVSSCFPRKGVDVLLEAFGLAFTKDDDVSLVIKTFPNPHNTVKEQISELKSSNAAYPDVVLIEDDLDDSRLKALYTRCDALVAPSFAEGFGLPLAEAILSGLPVITTGWGGQADFCREDTAWLLDYEFAPARSHFEVPNSVWAVTSAVGLASTLKEVRESPRSVLQDKTARAREHLLTSFKWTDVAQRLVDSSRLFARTSIERTPRVGWITTWQTRCGIAAYSEHLLNFWRGEHFIYARREGRQEAKEPNVRFTWDENPEETLADTLSAIKRDEINFLIIQLNYGFFRFDVLSRFIRNIHDLGCKIIIMLHSTIDPAHAAERRLSYIADDLKLCDRLLVHSHNDLNRLKDLGLVNNVAIFPHGVVDFEVRERTVDSETVKLGTYGFFLPHKGLLECIEATRLLNENGMHCELYMVNAEHPDPSSRQMIAQAEQKVRQHGLLDKVTINTSFLPDVESFTLLSEADFLLFPYQSTAESSSAAVRYGLAVGRPVVVSPSKIFDDVSDAVFKLDGHDAVIIANGVTNIRKSIIENESWARSKLDSARRWRDAHRYESVSRRLQRLVHSIWINDSNETEQISVQ